MRKTRECGWSSLKRHYGDLLETLSRDISQSDTEKEIREFRREKRKLTQELMAWYRRVGGKAMRIPGNCGFRIANYGLGDSRMNGLWIVGAKETPGGRKGDE